MKQLIYTFTDITQLDQYCQQQDLGEQKIILQIHSSDQGLMSTIYMHLNTLYNIVQIIPMLQENVETTLCFTLYDQATLLAPKDVLIEHDIYKVIIDATKEGFWLLDEELNIISINQSFANMLGYDRSELLGKKPYELLSLVDDQQVYCQTQAESAHTSTQRTYELTFITKEGEEVHTIVNATTLYLAEDEIRSFAFITDITQQKELEQQLLEQKDYINSLNSDLTRQVQEKVDENRSKDRIMYQQARLATMGEMIGNIAHQWRQPLNIIALIIQDFYISGQLGTLNSEKLEKEYTRANSVLQYMSNTIDDFRTFFQHNDAGETFCVKKSIDSVMSLVSKGLEYNTISVELELQESLYIFGHNNEFIQVLINIINNARDAIVATQREDGKITITASGNDTEVFIEIQDNGQGIDDKDLEQIFEPYFTTKHQSQGTGLGLYMSHQIVVNNMKGSIYAENRGEGMCFYITLPRAEAPEESVGRNEA